VSALPWSRRSFARDLFFLAGWAALIFFLSSIPRLESGLEQDYFLRKTAHVIEFAVLTILTVRVLRHASTHHLDVLFGSGLLAFIYALSDEAHQLLVPGRDGTLYDVGIDSVGIVLAVLLIVLWTGRQTRATAR